MKNVDSTSNYLPSPLSVSSVIYQSKFQSPLTMADALLTDLLKQLGSFAAQKALQELQLLAEVDDESKSFNTVSQWSRQCWTMPLRDK